MMDRPSTGWNGSTAVAELWAARGARRGRAYGSRGRFGFTADRSLEFRVEVLLPAPRGLRREGSGDAESVAVRREVPTEDRRGPSDG
jgi:hypothetical protein